jgi:hemin uptake protein HemP
MTRSSQQAPAKDKVHSPGQGAGEVVRIKSSELFGPMRELEIDHEGRIYRLRMTQLNKLILTA